MIIVVVIIIIITVIIIIIIIIIVIFFIILTIIVVKTTLIISFIKKICITGGEKTYTLEQNQKEKNLQKQIAVGLEEEKEKIGRAHV